jgi:hypothetical protein
MIAVLFIKKKGHMKQILKGQCHEIIDSGFFHESVSPKPLSKPLGLFRIFSKIRGDIRSSRWWQKKNIWEEESTYRYIFAFKFSSLILFPFFATMSMIPAPILPPVLLTPPASTTLAKLVAKFAASVVDTGGNFAAGIVDTGGKFATGCR